MLIESILLKIITDPGKIPPFKSNLPRPADFSRAIYTFDIGQNDLAYGFQHTTEEQVRKSIPDILNQFAEAVHVTKKSKPFMHLPVWKIILY